MGTRARRRETDSVERVRALTRRAYLASAGHLDLDEDPPPPSASFEQILHGPGEQREPAGHPPVRWRVSARAVAATVTVLGLLTGIVVVRSLTAADGAPVPLPTPVALETAPGPSSEAGAAAPDAADPDAADPALPATSPGTNAAPPAGDTRAAADASGAGPTVEQVVVHVAGAVVTPGIVTVAAGARVAEVVERAGGPTGSAELGAINLARTVTDGEQVFVPQQGEATPGAQAGPAPAAGGDGPAGAGTSEPAPVDLNTADQAALETLPGVGPAIARRILDWRRDNGGFHSVDELQEVPGIGPATMERLRPLVGA